MTIRYTATVTNGSWTEVGDYIAPGQPPRRFFTMTLTRVGDSDWPGAGGVTKQ
jgi:phage protein U